jgi:hypothetical protein
MGMMDMNKGKAGKPPRLISTTGKVNTNNDSAEGAGKAPSPPVGSKPTEGLMDGAVTKEK